MAIREQEVVAAVAGLQIVGNEEGLIPAFGLYLTRHYADYYNRISFACYHRAEREGPAARDRARAALIRAGEVCAFNTFGGIMLSQEWEAVVAPMIESREDCAHGMVAVVNALGRGKWRVDRLVPGEELAISIANSYESTGYLADHPERSDGGVCFLATGGASGIMNLLYNGDITTRPALTPQYFEQVFSTAGRFVARETACRANGAPRCELITTRS